MVLCSALECRKVIVSKQRAKRQKLLECDRWVLTRSPETQMVVFCDLVGVGIGPLSKKIAVNSFSRTSSLIMKAIERNSLQ